MINFEKKLGVYTIAIANVKFKNALSIEVMTAMLAALRESVSDNECRCIVIEGSAGTFSSGRMLGEGPKNHHLDDYIGYDTLWADIIRLISTTNIPSIAVVDGHAVAGGFTLAMACDFVVATTTARFGALEMRGGFPAAINTAVLAHKTPPRIALRYLLSKDLFEAPALYRDSLVNELAQDAAELNELKAAFSATLVGLDPTSARLTKELFRTCRAASPDAAIGIGQQLNSLLMASGKIGEASRSFERNKA